MLGRDAHLLLKLLEFLILLLPVIFNLLLCLASGVLYSLGAVLGVSGRSWLRGGGGSLHSRAAWTIRIAHAFDCMASAYPSAQSSELLVRPAGNVSFATLKWAVALRRAASGFPRSFGQTAKVSICDCLFFGLDRYHGEVAACGLLGWRGLLSGCFKAEEAPRDGLTAAGSLGRLPSQKPHHHNELNRSSRSLEPRQSLTRDSKCHEHHSSRLPVLWRAQLVSSSSSTKRRSPRKLFVTPDIPPRPLH